MAQRLSKRELVDLVVMLAKYELDLVDKQEFRNAQNVKEVKANLNFDLDKMVNLVSCPRCLALPYHDCRGEENQRLGYFHTDRYANFVDTDLKETN